MVQGEPKNKVAEAPKEGHGPFFGAIANSLTI